jgi:hypothetical protein
MLVTLLTISPLCDTLAVEQGTEDTGVEMVIRHMGIVLEKKPEIAQKRKQVEEELGNGTMCPKEACAHCHMPGQGAP